MNREIPTNPSLPVIAISDEAPLFVTVSSDTMPAVGKNT